MQGRHERSQGRAGHDRKVAGDELTKQGIKSESLLFLYQQNLY